MPGPIFRIQPEVQEYPAVQQTFENLTTVMFPLFFSIEFSSFLTTVEFPAKWGNKPVFWNQGSFKITMKTFENDLDFDLGIFGWTCGDTLPVELFSATFNLAADDTLKCLELESNTVFDVSPYDLLGLQLENTSHPTRTEFRILSAAIFFRPVVDEAFN